MSPADSVERTWAPSDEATPVTPLDGLGGGDAPPAPPKPPSALERTVAAVQTLCAVLLVTLLAGTTAAWLYGLSDGQPSWSLTASAYAALLLSFGVPYAVTLLVRPRVRQVGLVLVLLVVGPVPAAGTGSPLDPPWAAPSSIALALMTALLLVCWWIGRRRALGRVRSPGWVNAAAGLALIAVAFGGLLGGCSALDERSVYADAPSPDNRWMAVGIRTASLGRSPNRADVFVFRRAGGIFICQSRVYLASGDDYIDAPLVEWIDTQRLRVDDDVHSIGR